MVRNLYRRPREQMYSNKVEGEMKKKEEKLKKWRGRDLIFSFETHERRETGKRRIIQLYENCVNADFHSRAGNKRARLSFQTDAKSAMTMSPEKKSG